MVRPSEPGSSAELPRAARRRIGLFGGSFDPVHAGHLHAAHAALAAFELDRVVFVPAAQPPHKPGRRLADGAARLAMLALAIEGEPRFGVSALELERGGTSFTIDTVRALPAATGEPADADIFLILGSDNLVGFERWRCVEELLARVQPVIVERADEDWVIDPARARAHAAVAETLRAELGPQSWQKIEAGRLRVPPVPASSTDLRARLGTSADGRFAIAPPVLDYIRAHGLYADGR